MAKIAILYEFLGRSKGGIEAWVYHATEELFNQGHQDSWIKDNNGNEMRFHKPSVSGYTNSINQMEIIEILFNPITLFVIVLFVAIGFMASPYEIIYEDKEGIEM